MSQIETVKLLREKMEPELIEFIKEVTEASLSNIGDISSESFAAILIYKELFSSDIQHNDKCLSALLKYNKPLTFLTNAFQMIAEGYIPYEEFDNVLWKIERNDPAFTKFEHDETYDVSISMI